MDTELNTGTKRVLRVALAGHADTVALVHSLLSTTHLASATQVELLPRSVEVDGPSCALTDDLTPGTDVVAVITSRSAGNELHAWADEVAFHEGITAVHALISERVVVLGPTVRDRRGPCYHCLTLRKAAVRQGANAVASPPWPTLTNHAAALVVDEILALARDADLSHLASQVVYYDASDMRLEEHSVLPHPDCPRCNVDSDCARAKQASRYAAHITVQPSARRLRQLLVSPLTGLVDTLSLVRRPSHEPGEVRVAWAHIAGTTPTSGPSLALPVSADVSGRGWTAEQALLGALLEAVEHYSLARHIMRNPHLREVETNGTAAGTGVTDATVRAVLELLERHVFLSYWSQRLPVERVAVGTIPHSGIQELVTELGARRRTLDVYLLPTPVWARVACAVIRDPHGVPARAVGLGAGLSPMAAVTRAVTEAAQARRSLVLAVAAEPATYLVKGVQRPIGPLDHGLYYASADRAGAFAFLEERPEQPWPQRDDAKVHGRNFPAPYQEVDLARLLGSLSDHGIDVTTEDITPADVATLDLAVCRAMSQTALTPKSIDLLDQGVGDPHPLI